MLHSIENKQYIMESAKKKKINANKINGSIVIIINNDLSSYNRDLFYKKKMFVKPN